VQTGFVTAEEDTSVTTDIPVRPKELLRKKAAREDQTPSRRECRERQHPNETLSQKKSHLNRVVAGLP